LTGQKRMNITIKSDNIEINAFTCRMNRYQRNIVIRLLLI